MVQFSALRSSVGFIHGQESCWTVSRCLLGRKQNEGPNLKTWKRFREILLYFDFFLWTRQRNYGLLLRPGWHLGSQNLSIALLTVTRRVYHQVRSVRHALTWAACFSFIPWGWLLEPTTFSHYIQVKETLMYLKCCLKLTSTQNKFFPVHVGIFWNSIFSTELNASLVSWKGDFHPNGGSSYSV